MIVARTRARRRHSRVNRKGFYFLEEKVGASCIRNINSHFVSGVKVSCRSMLAKQSGGDGYDDKGDDVEYCADG